MIPCSKEVERTSLISPSLGADDAVPDFLYGFPARLASSAILLRTAFKKQKNIHVKQRQSNANRKT